MMWLYSIDIWLFRLGNRSLGNPVFDVVMPFLSGNRYFVPAAIVASLFLIWRGRTRGRLCLFFLVLGVIVTDVLVVKNLKDYFQRPRPFVAMADTQVRVGLGTPHASMPSGHAANWFAAAVIIGRFYRRGIYLALPLAVGVSFSRVYNGVHYPSDVLTGAILGASLAWLLLCACEGAWRRAGSKWFPLWWIHFPSLLHPDRIADTPTPENRSRPGEDIDRQIERHWLRLGYLVLAALLVIRWFYVAGHRIELSEDEAYQWIWSKHLALSYYSKPPLIAYTHYLGTHLWGDTGFGIRFFPPLIAAVMGWLLLRFFTREINARAGFFLMLTATAAPLLIAGSILMTIDPLSVLFWTAAMFTGWRAIHENRSWQWWLTGLWMGLGFLSKYTNLFMLVCWGLFFLLYKPTRPRLRQAGPWIALAINLACTVPVLIWNAQHDWITVSHVASNGGLNLAWRPTLRFFWDFLLAECGLLNPVFFVAAFWATLRFWRVPEKKPLMLYLFCMGAPLFLFYWLFTFRHRVLPNWIAPSIIPLFALMVAYWEGRWRQGLKPIKAALIGGLALGWIAAVLMHHPELMGKIAQQTLPARLDPLRRIRAWSNTTQVVEEARQRLLAEGKPVFIIGDHYGITAQMTFYLPEAKAAVAREPLIYYQSSDLPENQFYFWPGYDHRKGQNAIYVSFVTEGPEEPPARLVREFDSVTDLGIKDVMYRGQVYRRVQLHACRNLR